MSLAATCHILVALLLFMGPTQDNLEHVVVVLARHYEVNPALAARVVDLECPRWDPEETGDDGAAVGLWQWHLESWLLVRQHMGASLEDLRADPVESTRTAMYAWSVMGLQRWWTTYEQAQRPSLAEEAPHGY